MSAILLLFIISVINSNGHELCSTLDGQVTVGEGAYVASPNLERLKGNYAVCQGECIKACSGKITDEMKDQSCKASGRNREPTDLIKQKAGTECQWTGKSGKVCGGDKTHPGYRAVCKRPEFAGGIGFTGHLYV